MNVIEVYDVLLDYFGERNWWPGDSRLEICISAILTQNTSWKNVEKSLNNLKNLKLLPKDEKNYLNYTKKIYHLKDEKLAEIIRSCGFYRSKVRTIKLFLKFLIDSGGFEKLKNLDDYKLREELLRIKGIGNETADAIMLYAFDRLSFVIDNYTIRVLNRHGVKFRNYYEYKLFFESNVERSLEIYKEFHALFVELGKTFCKKSKPMCSSCPLGYLL